MKKVVGILLIVVFFALGILSDKVGFGNWADTQVCPYLLFIGLLCFLVGIYLLIIDELEARSTIIDELEARSTL